MDYRRITTLQELLEYISGAPAVAFDLETAPVEPYRQEEKAALDPRKARVAGISFSVAENSGAYLPLTHRAGENASGQENIWQWLKDEFFQSGKVIKIAHNLAFEAMFLYARGIVLQPPCRDTIAAAQLTLKSNAAFRNLADSGLKRLAAELFGAKLPSFRDVTQGRPFDELDPEDAETIRYACADSDYALRLYHLFNDWFERCLPKHKYIAWEIEAPAAAYAGIMKCNGLLADRELMEDKRAKAQGELAQLKERIAALPGGADIGANAGTAAFRKHLYGELKLPVFKLTARRQEAMDDEALMLLAEWCEASRPELVSLFKLVQEYRRWGKLQSTYIDGYLKHINPATGRIHPDLLPLATETGRFAARNPNLQNMPRSGTDDVGVRNFFVAPPGSALLSLDFSQIELRVGAFYCQDERMLKTYREGGDIHSQTAAVIYRVPLGEAMDKNSPGYKDRRTIAKNCNFGTFFGLFPKGLQRTLKFKAGLNTSLAECEKIIQNLKAGYPRLAQWQDETKARASLRRYSETYLGRRRYLPGITSEDWGKKSFAERCALNTPIQGTAADILKLALARILAGLPERLWLKPILQIHDELVFELPEDKAQEAAAFVKKCMEAQPFPEFGLPIVAEASVGAKFGEMKELEALQT